MPQAKNKNHNQAEAKAKSKVASIPVVKPPDSHQPQQNSLIQASQNQQQGSSQLAPNSSSNSEIKIKNQIHQNQISEQPEQLVQVVRQDLVLDDDEPSEVSPKYLFLTLFLFGQLTKQLKIVRYIDWTLKHCLNFDVLLLNIHLLSVIQYIFPVKIPCYLLHLLIKTVLTMKVN